MHISSITLAAFAPVSRRRDCGGLGAGRSARAAQRRTHRCIGFSDTRIGDSEPIVGVAASGDKRQGGARCKYIARGARAAPARARAADARGGGAALEPAAAEIMTPLWLGVDAIGDVGSAQYKGAQGRRQRWAR